MSNPTPRNITVVINVETGEVINSTPNGDPHDPPAGADCKVSWAESSPGCVYVRHAGGWRRVCFT